VSLPAPRHPHALQPRVAPWLLLTPAALFFVCFLLIPIGYAVWLSFRGLKVTGGVFGTREETFVGVDNYVSALTDPQLAAGLGHALLYGAIEIPSVLGLALLFALLLDSPRARTRGFARVAIFLPYAVPGVIASLLWGFLYLPSTSPVSAITRQLGGSAVDFLSSPQLYFAIANIALWGGVGFNMIIIYTALRSVPTEIYEAARVDGASEWTIAWRIKIPLVAPALVLTGLFSVIGTFQLYNEPQTLRPIANSISSTWAPLMKIYNLAFAENDLGGAAAASVLLAILILVLSVFLLRFFQKRTFGAAE
jgi:multiple sugar transport system permease protein